MADDRTSTIMMNPSTLDETSAAAADTDCVLSILGVPITDVTWRRVVELIEEMVQHYDGRTRSIFVAHAHTLNLAAGDRRFHEVLHSADYVFGDGTGVRWAAQLQGIRLRDNLVGTDLVPAVFDATADRGYRYFMLGADEESIFRAARHAAARFPGWIQSGYHHGYLSTPELNARVVRQINEARPHLLLVGQGSPIQERWICENQHALKVPVCMTVGGLFNYWAGDIHRSPAWLRRRGLEWLGILRQQPRKARRYLIGNPQFVVRVLWEYWTVRQR